jgi:hypothetical protein
MAAVRPLTTTKAPTGLAAFLAATPAAFGVLGRICMDGENALTCGNALLRIAVDVPQRSF